MRFKTRLMSDLRRVEVEVGEISEYERDDGMRVFYEMNTVKKITPPEDISLQAFTDLDPEDENMLYDFQSEWGLITSVSRLGEHGSGRTSDRISFNFFSKYRCAFCDEIKATRETEQIKNDHMQHVKDSFGKITLKMLNDNAVPPDYAVPLTSNKVASLKEVSEVVRNTQTLIRSSNAVKLGSKNENDILMSELFLEGVAAIVEFRFPCFELIDNDYIDSDSFKPLKTLPFIESLYLSHALSLADEEGYKTCENPECGRIFQYQSGGRRKNSKYCSRECQVRAKRLREASREKTRAARKELNNG